QNGVVAIDLSEYGFLPKSKVELAKRIALIQQIEEGKLLYDKTDDTVMMINFRGEKGKFPGHTALKKLGFLLVNFVIDITSFGLDLLYSGFYIPATITNVILRAFNREPFKLPDFPSSQSFLQKWQTTESVYKNLASTAELFNEDTPITQLTQGGLL